MRQGVGLLIPALGSASLCGWPIVAGLGVYPLCQSRSSWSSGRQGGESGGVACVDACEFPHDQILYERKWMVLIQVREVFEGVVLLEELDDVRVQ